jgi:acyl-CoA thioesterase-1
MRTFFLLVLAVASTVAASTAPQQDRPRIVALGDSLTSGQGIGQAEAYPAALQERLESSGYQYQVVNAGISGDTTRRALRRYREALDGDVKVLIVALGANDGLRGVPVDELTSNLSDIIEAAQRRGIAVVLIGMDALPVHGWDYSVAFHRAYDRLAARYRIPLVPSFLMKILTDASLMQRDGAHPNKAGARAIADLVWPHLQPLLTKGDSGDAHAIASSPCGARPACITPHQPVVIRTVRNGYRIRPV